jgi:hypothetical protein
MISARLEGKPGLNLDIKQEKTGQAVKEKSEYVPEDPDLDRDITRLHVMARTGELPSEDAERQINTYLLAAACANSRLENTRIKSRWLIMRLNDAPQAANLPDLGQVLHRVMMRSPIPCSLSKVVEQSIPCFRHSMRVIPYTDSQPVLISLVMATLLGTYPMNAKKTVFGVRVEFFRRIHSLLTASPEAQTRFCAENEPVVLLSCMEYVSRIGPVFFPVQHAFMTSCDASTAAFMRRIPSLCDELRQALNEQGGMPWPVLRQTCFELVQKVSRFKRCHRSVQRIQQQPQTIQDSVVAHWEAPFLPSRREHEYRLLASGLGLNQTTIQYIQQSLGVWPLPKNLTGMQIRALLSQDGATKRVSFLKTHRYVCMHCAVVQKNATWPKLRLNVSIQRVVCTACMKPDIIHVNLLGRILWLHKTFYYFCPCCTTVQPYTGEGITWRENEGCAHVPEARSKSRRGKTQCLFCSEPAGGGTVERVDHLTGEMHSFHYCQRHMPRHEVLRDCHNVQDMRRAHARMPRGLFHGKL